MRTFFELLPHRIARALHSRTWGIVRTRLGRISSAQRRQAGEKTPSQRPRLYIDLAVISQNDAGTGIQRVVRALALALLEAPGRWDVRIVSARRKRSYHHIAWPMPDPTIAPQDMRARPGDVFLGLDYSLDAIRRHRRQLARFRRDGGRLWFLVHDLLPLNRPEWFSQNTILRYRAWIAILSRVADGFLCNSRQTDDDLREALTRFHGLSTGYRTQILPMGYVLADGGGTNDTTRPTHARFDMSTPFALMVGTLEPRKGHEDVLHAYDVLWREGHSGRLVLVGRLGWQVDALREEILNHPEYGRKLFWFNDVDDPELVQIYDACTGMIIASHAEGFGLPLIEALGRGKPVLARDLPIFRIHEGNGIRFFPASATPEALAVAVRHWIDEAQAGLIAVSRPESDWGDAARLLLQALEPCAA